eukprot:TRINITY_DN111110_c0_g1_i1.p1 TRINITY_DN111110_c0_g1~~TRINITY_DN111110_c0_g1_i1.p1  ORF type:complete len:507 (-),score=115.46 TRINITY_DN111110_c0_g1_i1:30-1550(-)
MATKAVVLSLLIPPLSRCAGNLLGEESCQRPAVDVHSDAWDLDDSTLDSTVDDGLAADMRVQLMQIRSNRGSSASRALAPTADAAGLHLWPGAVAANSSATATNVSELPLPAENRSLLPESSLKQVSAAGGFLAASREALAKQEPLPANISRGPALSNVSLPVSWGIWAFRGLPSEAAKLSNHSRALLACLGLSLLVVFSMLAELFREFLFSKAIMNARLMKYLRRQEKLSEQQQQAEMDSRLPSVCPEGLSLVPDAVLSMPVAPCNGFTWSVDVSGLAEAVQRSPANASEAHVKSSPKPAALDTAGLRLSASLRWAKRDGCVARTVEMVLQRDAQGPQTLVSISSCLEVRLADGEHFGWLKMVSSGKYILRDRNGEAVMVLSADPASRRMEMANLPEGRLVSTAVRTAGAGERLEVSARGGGVDVIFSLSCALAVLVFAPLPSSRRDGSAAPAQPLHAGGAAAAAAAAGDKAALLAPLAASPFGGVAAPVRDLQANKEQLSLCRC